MGSVRGVGVGVTSPLAGVSFFPPKQPSFRSLLRISSRTRRTPSRKKKERKEAGHRPRRRGRPRRESTTPIRLRPPQVSQGSYVIFDRDSGEISADISANICKSRQHYATCAKVWQLRSEQPKRGPWRPAETRQFVKRELDFLSKAPAKLAPGTSRFGASANLAILSKLCRTSSKHVARFRLYHFIRLLSCGRRWNRSAKKSRRRCRRRLRRSAPSSRRSRRISRPRRGRLSRRDSCRPRLSCIFFRKVGKGLRI